MNNNPIGSTKKLIQSSTVMEMVNDYIDQELYCIADSDSNPTYRKYFDKHGYTVLKNLYDPQKLYSVVPKERGQVTFYGSPEFFSYIPEESQVPGSLSRYNHPQYKQAHTEIRLILEHILGEKLYNTYYYDRFYFCGQRLNRHKDRDSCEISVSVQVSTNAKKPWPFCIETSNGEEHFANLQDGWGFLYMGCEREHWRDALESRYSNAEKLWNKMIRKQDDTYHHQVFFHYVRANGPRSHFANDSAQ